MTQNYRIAYGFVDGEVITLCKDYLNTLYMKTIKR